MYVVIQMCAMHVLSPIKCNFLLHATSSGNGLTKNRSIALLLDSQQAAAVEERIEFIPGRRAKKCSFANKNRYLANCCLLFFDLQKQLFLTEKYEIIAECPTSRYALIAIT